MAQLPATRSNDGGRISRREHPLARLARDFDALFDRILGGSMASTAQDLTGIRLWDFNVTENDREVIVRAEMPGFEENEIDVQLNQDTLTIKAEKEQRDDRDEEYRSFFRTVTLPPGIDAEKVRATYRNGVLELHIPRAADAQPKRIAIQGEPGTNGAAASRAGDQGKQPANSTGSMASSEAKR